MTTVFRLAKGIRFLCDLALGGGICMLSICVVWMIYLLLSPVITGGTRHTISGVLSFAIGEAGSGQVPPVSPTILEISLGVGESVFLKSLPVTVASKDSGVIISPRFSGTVGEMIFQTNSRRIHILLFLGMIVPGILYLGILYHVRQFLVDAVQGVPFAFDNAQRLKWIGWLLLAIGVVKPAMNYLIGSRILSAITVQGPMLSPWVDLSFVSTCVLVAFFSLILSVIFRHGVELEKERSLTV